MSSFPKSRSLASLALSAFVLLAACAKQPPSLMKQVDDPKISREELRARVYEEVLLFSGKVETVAYGILEEAKDIRVSRGALIWLSSAVPAVQSAALRNDPVSGMVDLWALSIQQRNFFEAGGGSEYFGPYHGRVVDVSREIVTDVRGIGQVLMGAEQYERVSTNLEEWATEHPIESLLFSRASTGPMTASMVGSPGGSAFAAVGSMADEVRDLSARLSVYSELVPKQARWQAGLLLTAEASGMSFYEMFQNMEKYVSQIEEVTVFLDSVKVFMDSVPGLIAGEREVVLNDISAERIAVMRELNAMLALTLAAIEHERQAVMSSITDERVATMQQLDAAAERLTELALDKAEVRVEEAIDHFFWRLVQVLAVLAVLVVVAGYFFLRRFVTPTRPPKP